MWSVFDDECNVLEDALSNLVPNTATDKLRAREASGWNLELERDSPRTPGEEAARDREGEVHPGEEFLKGKREGIRPFSRGAEPNGGERDVIWGCVMLWRDELAEMVLISFAKGV